MTISQDVKDTVQITAENIGGIDNTEVSLTPGVNVLTGRNATNRTSFLQSIMAVLGSDAVTLKGDAEEGHAELEIDDETYSRTLARNDNGVKFSGEPYLDDPELAELFAFLLETNEARRTVARQGDLREVIMRPVDTEEINAEIAAAEEEKRQVTREIEQLDEVKTELTSLEQQRIELEQDIDDKEDELADKRADLAEVEDGSNVEEQQDELDDVFDELQAARSELDDVEFRLETQRKSLDALLNDKSELETALEELPEPTDEKVSELETERDRLHDHKASLDSTMTELQRVIQFNEQMVDGANKEIGEAFETGGDETAITDQLVEETVTCWTCGSEVTRDAIDDTIDQLRDLRQEKVEERRRIKSELEEVETEKRQLEEQQREREQAVQQLDQTEDEIEEREDTIEDLEGRQEEIKEEISRLEDRVEELEQQDQSQVFTLQKEVNQLEFELESLQDELEETEGEIESLQAQLDREDDLEQQREQIQERLTELRTKIEQLEAQAVEAFNDHMQTVLDILEYENIDRIWIERTEETVREGRKKVSKSTFALHVIRKTEDGASYEDTINHLSESEREVTGLVFALAGFLVHDVYETVPFMLLDSLEAVDSERIARLVDYLHEYAPYLVVALLPEDASALDETYRRITEI
ncbi:archaea-specific SMC-related protein [Halorussus salinisoli]|uniref:archaea-specific SMC-related protein n=1 Tax=Halorussus salinisoli TaxID=2558242 RepID=UPI0010C1D6D7|nr:archaea-specific SMC-related protein [Halorussus salinisoli]